MKSHPRLFWACGLAAFFPLTTLAAGRSGVEPGDAPIADALAAVSEDVRIYNDHLTILASPWMEGRVPGSKGMERAMEYCEDHLRQTGLIPAFPLTELSASGAEVVTPNASFRQPFELGGTRKVTQQDFAVTADGRTTDLVANEDFSVLGLSESGEATGELVFVGYAIGEGPDGYASFEEGDDFAGKIVLMLRFEPVNEDGSSKWAEGGQPWSARASFNTKMQAIRDRNPAAVVIINTPGTHDVRADQLVDLSGSGGRGVDAPVVMMSTAAADELVRKADPEGRSLLELRQLADEGRTIIPLDATATIATRIETDSLLAENIGGILPGKGDLADEYIVIGAHLDHLGMGYFGSRDQSAIGELHPGADDNASGSAAILVFADKMKGVYDALPADADARSILFMLFSGEESGLNGSRYYTNNPIVPIDDHALMMNFDMIGRIENGRLSVSGYTTGEGFGDWVKPYFADTPLTVVANDRINGASDHTPFMQKQIPVLFGIIADFHADYHTPADVSEKINRVGAVHTVDLFANIATGVATRPERFAWAQPAGGRAERPAAARGGGESALSVRVGVSPVYGGDETGVAIGDVAEDSPASRAGILAGDRLIRWDGQKIEDIGAWTDMLLKNKPGDKLTIGVLRDGEEVTLEIELEGR